MLGVCTASVRWLLQTFVSSVVYKMQRELLDEGLYRDVDLIAALHRGLGLNHWEQRKTGSAADPFSDKM